MTLFIGRQRLMAGQLAIEHRQVCFRSLAFTNVRTSEAKRSRAVFLLDTALQARAQDTFRSLYIENHERDARLIGHDAQLVALVSLEKGGVHDHRMSGPQDDMSQLRQPRISASAGLGRVNPAVDRRATACVRCQSVQAFALDIAAQPDGAKALQQWLRKPGLAAARQTVGDDERSTRCLGVTLGEIRVAEILLAYPPFFFIAQVALA